MSESNNFQYHDVAGIDGHFLVIDFPDSPNRQKVTEILNDVKQNGHHAQFFDRSGAYVYYLQHNGDKKIYVGQATNLESRALDKSRLANENVSCVILFSNTGKNQFDEAEIQHLEYTILSHVNNSNMLVKNAQSVAASITSPLRIKGIEDWFDVVKNTLIVLKFPGFSDAYEPIGEYIEIYLERDNSTHYCSAGVVGVSKPVRFYTNTKRVFIPKGTIASHRRLQVPRTYQKVKTGLITGKVLVPDGPKGEHGHESYVFTKNKVLMNISEATTIILNAPQGANAWRLSDTGEVLQDSEYWR